MVELHYGHLIPSDDEINVGVYRRDGKEPTAVPEAAEHLQLSWELLKDLVWKMPMREAAREVPGVHSEGETLQEAKENLMDAFHTLLAYMPTGWRKRLKTQMCPNPPVVKPSWSLEA